MYHKNHFYVLLIVTLSVGNQRLLFLLLNEFFFNTQFSKTILNS